MYSTIWKTRLSGPLDIKHFGSSNSDMFDATLAETGICRFTYISLSVFMFVLLTFSRINSMSIVMNCLLSFGIVIPYSSIFSNNVLGCLKNPPGYG